MWVFDKHPFLPFKDEDKRALQEEVPSLGHGTHRNPAPPDPDPPAACASSSSSAPLSQPPWDVANGPALVVGGLCDACFPTDQEFAPLHLSQEKRAELVRAKMVL